MPDDQLCQDLRAVDALLASPEKWIKRRYAETAQGIPVRPSDPKAVAWCLVGACERVTGPIYRDDYVESVIVRRRALAGALVDAFTPTQRATATTGFIPAINDAPRTTFRTVKNIIGRAVKNVCP